MRGTRTGCILAINSPRLSVMSKKNFSPVIVALIVIGAVPCVDQVKLEAAQIFDVAVSGERPEEGGKLANGADVGGLRVGLELAHAHVVEHALAQRRDGAESRCPWLCSCR